MEGIPVALRFLFKRRGLECQRASSHVDIGMNMKHAKGLPCGSSHPGCDHLTLNYQAKLWRPRSFATLSLEQNPGFCSEMTTRSMSSSTPHENTLVYVTATLQLALGLWVSFLSDFLFALNPPFIQNLRNSSDWICMAPWTSGDSAIGPTCARPSPARRSADPSAFSWRKRRQSD